MLFRETSENLRFQNRLISNVTSALAMMKVDTSPEGVTARETVLVPGKFPPAANPQFFFVLGP